MAQNRSQQKQHQFETALLPNEAISSSLPPSQPPTTTTTPSGFANPTSPPPPVHPASGNQPLRNMGDHVITKNARW